MDTEQDAKKEVAILNTESAKLIDQVFSTTIKNDDALKAATDLLVAIKRVAKDIEKRRKTITQPLTLAVRNVNALFKDPSDRLADAEKLIKDAMIAYQEKLEKRAAKKAQKIEDAVDSGQLDMADAMGKLSTIKAAPDAVKTDSGTASYKTITKIRITNPGLLPAKYFMRERVVEALRIEVEEDVRKKAEPVPNGAEAYEEKQMAVRGA